MTYVNDLKCASRFLSHHLPTNELEKLCHKLELYMPFQDQAINLSMNEKKHLFSSIIANATGYSLLFKREIRTLLSENGVKIPKKKWSHGGKTELSIVRQLDLPDAYSGVHLDAHTLSIETVQSAKPPRTPMDYQREVIAKAVSSLESNFSCLISVPTGAGKTFIASNILRDIHKSNTINNVFLWIAHTEELCEQSISSMADLWRSSSNFPDMTIMRGWGKHHKAISKYGKTFSDTERSKNIIFCVVTPQTLEKTLSNPDTDDTLFRVATLADIVVIDEAHRAGASSYLNIVRALSSGKGEKKAFFLGLSATPVRSSFSIRAVEESNTLRKIFPNLIEPTDTIGNKNYFDHLVSKGVLSNPVFHQTKPKSRDEISSYIASFLKRNTDTPRRSIVFCSSISESNAIAASLNMKGIPSISVSSRDDEAERAQYLQLLRSGEIEVICNCEILTTGFDLPGINNIFLLRPTSSPVLYKQMIGRGLRGPEFGGSEECHIHIMGFNLSFPLNPNTDDFVKAIW